MLSSKVGFWLVAAAALLCVACNPGGTTGELFSPSSGVAQAPDNAALPGYGSAVVPWEDIAAPGSLLVAVRVAPQPELVAGDGKMTASLSSIPFIAPPAKTAGTRSVSDAAPAAGYYYSENVGESVISADVEGGAVTFDATKATALACFELAKPQPQSTSGAWTVGLAWYSLPAEMDGYCVGIGDAARAADGSGAWHWYAGPDDGVLSFDPTAWPGGAPAGDSVLVCVALEPGAKGQAADFWKLRGGVPEVRGTGLLPNDPVPAPTAPRLASKTASSLPASFDLTPYAAPINDQGQMGSCTAFGVADAAYNIMLNQLYGNLGWDPTQDATRVSPMYSYVRSGITPIGNWSPPCGVSVGRYMSQAFEELKQVGSCNELTVPYYATENCSTTFPDEAATQAQLLRIDNWYNIGGTGTQMVDNIKQYLANLQTPVVIAMYGLESGFLYYSGGVYHYGGSQGYAGGHSMCIVGYDDTLQAFNVRNSWGGGWGNAGYWWCGYDAVQALTDEGGRFSAYFMTATYNQDAAVYFFDAAPEYDESEPNNTKEQANALPVFDFGDYTGSLASDSVDWYSFSYEATYTTEFTVNFNQATLLPLMELYSADGTLVAQSSGSGGTLTVGGVWGQSGVGRLKMIRVSGSGDYVLSGVKRRPPASPTGVAATDGSAASSVTVSWNTSTGASTYYIQRAPAQAGPFNQIGSTFAMRYVDNSAAPWTQYWYRVVAASDEGSSLPSTPDSGYRGAVAPADVSASNGTYSDRVELSWAAVDGATKYLVRRGISQQGPFEVLGEATSLALVDQHVAVNSIYYYTVAALNNQLEGAESAPVSGRAAKNFQEALAAQNAGNQLAPQDGTPGDPGPINVQPAADRRIRTQ